MAHEAFTSLLTECMPFCVFSAVTCSALLAPPNGIRQGCTGTTTEYYSTVCLFSCNAGFIATGSPSRKCLRNGTWSGQEFLCQGEINYYSSPYRRPWRKTSQDLWGSLKILKDLLKILKDLQLLKLLARILEDILRILWGSWKDPSTS